MVLLLSVQWFQVTNGKPSIFRLPASGRKHTVTLTWKASSSQVAGYNVYRSRTSGGNYLRINPSPVPGLSYSDNTVENGVAYYYVTRAVDAQGRESVNSSETSAAVP
jgi:fibronectin type 3 domain-containing protein